MRKTIGMFVTVALGVGASLQVSAQGPTGDANVTSKYAGTKSACEQMADAKNFVSHSDRHWFVLRCMTES